MELASQRAFLYFYELGDSKELKILGGEACGKGAWKWFQSGFKQFQTP